MHTWIYVIVFILMATGDAIAKTNAKMPYLDQYMNCSRDYGDRSILSKEGLCEVEIRDKYCAKLYALPQDVQRYIDYDMHCDFSLQEVASEPNSSESVRKEVLIYCDQTEKFLDLIAKYSTQRNIIRALLFFKTEYESASPSCSFE